MEMDQNDQIKPAVYNLNLRISHGISKLQRRPEGRLCFEVSSLKFRVLSQQHHLARRRGQ